MTYIDTQGMSLPSTDVTDNTVEHEPMNFKKLTAFTEMEIEELKEIIREVLHEYI